MDTLGKFSSSVSKKLQGKKTSSNNSSGGQGLRETVKEATAKTLRRPDPDLNQQVADLIGSAIHTEGPHEVANILTERLTLKNPHKVWLAVELIKEVLRKCETELNPVRDDIMAEVGKVASSAMNRFNSNLADQQRAKSAAFELLKTYGHDGHILSQPHVGNGRRASIEEPRSPTQVAEQRERGSPRQYHSWPELSEAVQTQIAVAISHNDLLQDMLLDPTTFEAKTPQERALAKDIILEATQFRQSFEALLAQLSAYDSSEANMLMNAALEKMDILNNSLTLHKEMLKKQLQGQRPARTHSAPKADAQQAPQTAAPQRPAEPDFGGLLELQPGLEAANQPAQPSRSMVQDPFAASNQWQPGPQQPPPGWPAQQRPPDRPPPQSQPSAQQQPTNPFSPASSGWPGQPGSAPGGYPGYGYGAYNQGYNNGQNYGQGYSQGPPPPQFGQGHGQPQQQWSMPPPGQGYGGPPPGYGGHYGYQNPYSQPQQSFHPGPDYNGLPPDANQAQQGNKAHVPAPMTEANIILPARSTDRPPATAGPSTTAEDKIEEVAASTPLTGTVAKSEEQPLAPPEAPPAAPATPPAQHLAPNGSQATPSPARSYAAPASEPAPTSSIEVVAPADDFGFGESAFGSAGGPAPAAEADTAVKAGSEDPGAKQAPAHSQPSEDDWDMFFAERVSSGKLENKLPSAPMSEPSKPPTDQLTNAFGQLATARSAGR